MRKNILIIIVVAVVALGAILVYFLIFRSGTYQSVPVSNQNTGDAALNTSADQAVNPAAGIVPLPAGTDLPAVLPTEDEAVDRLKNFQRLTQNSIIGPTLSSDGQRIQYYDSDEMILQSINLLGFDPITLGTPSEEIKEIVWAPDKTKLSYKTVDGRYYYFDTAKNTEQLLPSGIQRLVFTGDSQKICYQYRDELTGLSSLNIADPAKELADHQSLIALQGNYQLSWVPMTNFLSYQMQPVPQVTSPVYLLDVNTKAQQIIINQAMNLQTDWNFTGTQVLYSRLGSAGQLELWLADQEGKYNHKLDRATWAWKTAWSPLGDKLYLAVPEQLSRGRAWYQPDTKTQDTVYVYDLRTQKTGEIMNLSTVIPPLDVRSMMVTPNGKLLYFENGYDHSLYVINLEKLEQKKYLLE